MKKSLVAAAVVAVLLPVSAACDSSKDIATTDPTTTPSTPSTPTTPADSTPPPTTPTTPPTNPPPTSPTPSQVGNRLSGTGFSIAIPADWEDITASLKADNPQLDIAIGEKNPSTFRTNFNVVTANPTSATIQGDSEPIRKEAATELKTVTHAVVSALPDSIIDGEPAIGQTSTFVPPGSTGSVTFLQYVAIHNGMAYPLTMTFATANAADAKPLLASILDSWQWAT